MNPKHIMKHLSRYRVEAVDAEGLSGLVLLDTGAESIVATGLLFDEDGMPVAGRLILPAGTAGGGIGAAIAADVSRFSEGMLLSHVLDYFGLRGRPATFGDAVAAGFMVRPEGQGADRQSVLDAASAWLNANGIHSLSGRLHGEALECLSCAAEFKRAAYAFYANASDLGVFRRQAANAYPLLAVEISSKLAVKMAVDRKQPLQEVLIRAFGTDEIGNPRLTKPLLKRLANKKLPDGGVPVQVIVNALSEIPADWFPKTDEEWTTFLDITDTFFRRLGPDLGVKASDIAKGASGRWSEFAQRLASAYAFTQAPEDLDDDAKKLWKPNIDVSRQSMSEAVENARDVIQAFRNLVILPLAANAGQGVPVFVGPEQLRLASDVAASILYGNQSMSYVLELQRHWHTQAHNIEAAAAADAPWRPTKMVADDGWAPMCDIILAPNGLEIHPLTDPRELKDEGASGVGRPGPDSHGIMGLGHCVGGYSESCRSGRSHILSFRMPTGDGSFERVSTVEFGAFGPDDKELRKVQHHGAGNGPAPEAGKQAYEWFVAEVRDGRIPLNHEGVMTYLTGRRKIAEEVESYSGYDWREQEALIEAIRPWRDYMPKRIRGLDIDSLQALPELGDLIQGIAPSFARSSRMR